MVWSPENIERVKTLAASGFSASQIATQIGGVTRNAIVGVGHRNKFQFHGQSGGGAPRAPRPPRPRPPKAGMQCEPIYEVRPGMVTLADLEYDGCKYIFGDVQDPAHRYCNQAQWNDTSWCPYHADKVFEPRIK